MSQQWPEEEQDHGLKYIWACPEGHYEYEEWAGWNEALPCPICQKPCLHVGDIYDARPID